MSYKSMAYLYDELMLSAPYDQWLEFTNEVFQAWDKKVTTIADLGCGTGELTIKLAREGYSVFGVDYSSEMLTYAEQKASKENLSIKWLQQDLRKLTGFNDLDAVVSYCDVINYITAEDELKTVFSNIFSALKVDGIFIFDVHALEYVQKHLINKTFTEVTDDVCYIWDCFEGENKGEMFHELTFFTSDENDKYNRFEELHHQRTYSTGFYKQLLKDVGFVNVSFYSDFSLERDKQLQKQERIFFIAEKRSR